MPLVAGFLCCLLACRTIEKKRKSSLYLPALLRWLSLVENKFKFQGVSANRIHHTLFWIWFLHYSIGFSKNLSSQHGSILNKIVSWIKSFHLLIHKSNAKSTESTTAYFLDLLFGIWPVILLGRWWTTGRCLWGTAKYDNVGLLFWILIICVGVWIFLI